MRAFASGLQALLHTVASSAVAPTGTGGHSYIVSLSAALLASSSQQGSSSSIAAAQFDSAALGCITHPSSVPLCFPAPAVDGGAAVRVDAVVRAGGDSAALGAVGGGGGSGGGGAAGAPAALQTVLPVAATVAHPATAYAVSSLPSAAEVPQPPSKRQAVAAGYAGAAPSTAPLSLSHVAVADGGVNVVTNGAGTGAAVVPVAVVGSAPASVVPTATGEDDDIEFPDIVEE